MIDIMFFLLVFFMMTSLSMVDLHSLGVQLPRASAAQAQPSAQYVVTLKADGSLWLNGQPVGADELLASARDQQRQDSAFSVVLCADRGLDYGQVADVSMPSSGPVSPHRSGRRQGRPAMKPWEKRRGRVAAGVSVSLHVAVYLALAAGGFFTLIHHYTRQDGVTDVMVYNADDLAGAGGHDAAGTDTDEAVSLSWTVVMEDRNPRNPRTGLWQMPTLRRLIRMKPVPTG